MHLNLCNQLMHNFYMQHTNFLKEHNYSQKSYINAKIMVGCCNNKATSLHNAVAGAAMIIEVTSTGSHIYKNIKETK